MFLRYALTIRRVVLGALLLAAAHAGAQTYQDRPVRLLVTSPPGGANDIQARTIGVRLSEYFGQQLVIDNRGGASGMIAAEIVARAPPDGYTLLAGTNSTFAVNPTLFPAVPYDTLRDFAMVSVTTTTPHVLLVHASIAARTVPELIALARAQPGKLNYASSGSGSAFHLGMELLKATAGIQVVHVPFKGSALSASAMLAGDVQLMLVGLPTGMSLAKSGKARALAVANPKRSALVPELPTIAEAGVLGFGYDSWFGTVAPARAPRPIITRLHESYARALAQPDVRERLAQQGYDVISDTPAQMAARIREETKKWAKVIRDSGAKPE